VPKERFKSRKGKTPKTSLQIAKQMLNPESYCLIAKKKKEKIANAYAYSGDTSFCGVSAT